jgi:hypothetical protein
MLDMEVSTLTAWWYQGWHQGKWLLKKAPLNFASKHENFDVCVLQQYGHSSDDAEMFQKEYLQLCGGQSIIQCRTHCMWLVTSARNIGKEKHCSKCGHNFPRYECPITSCSVSVCGKHWKTLLTEGRLENKAIHLDTWEKSKIHAHAESSDEESDNLCLQINNSDDNGKAANSNDSMRAERGHIDDISFPDEEDSEANYLEQCDMQAEHGDIDDNSFANDELSETDVLFNLV